MRIITCTTAILLLLSTIVMADPIDNRLGLTGRVGAILPLQDSHIGGTAFETGTGFAGGGGLIYGFCDNFATEIDVIHAPSMDVKIGGAKVSEASLTNVGLGLLYRITPGNSIVPYLGIGADAIKGDIEDSRLDWTFGGHVNGGVDYFVTGGIAFNVDIRALFAAESDIKKSDVTVGKFDPSSIIATVGVRLFLPEGFTNP